MVFRSSLPKAMTNFHAPFALGQPQTCTSGTLGVAVEQETFSRLSSHHPKRLLAPSPVDLWGDPGIRTQSGSHGTTDPVQLNWIPPKGDLRDLRQCCFFKVLCLRGEELLVKNTHVHKEKGPWFKPQTRSIFSTLDLFLRR